MMDATHTTQTRAERTLGAIVAKDQRTAAVFDRHGIDFCCGGDRTLQAACAEADVDVEAVLDDIRQLRATPSSAEVATERFNQWAPDFLCDYITNQHHAYAREALPRIEALAEKVAGVHGEDHRETREIAELWPELRGEMSQHTQKEELLLWPYVKKLVQAEREGTTVQPPKFGSAQALINEMEAEHDDTGDHLARIQALSNGFAPPADACGSFRMLYRELQAFDADTKRHVHLENHVLFPKALRLEERLLDAGRSA